MPRLPRRLQRRRRVRGARAPAAGSTSTRARDGAARQGRRHAQLPPRAAAVAWACEDAVCGGARTRPSTRRSTNRCATPSTRGSGSRTRWRRAASPRASCPSRSGRRAGRGASPRRRSARRRRARRASPTRRTRSAASTTSTGPSASTTSSLYDCGIQLDAESWYSVTPEKIALAIAARCRPTDVVVDAFCGCGGNAIALARRCRHVVAIDIDAAKVEKARRNARIYGVAVDFVVGDALVLLKTLRADVCFLSPPWGGPGYGEDFRLEAIDVQGVDGFGLLRLAAACAPRVAYYLPRTLSVEEAARLAPIVEVESQYLNDKLKAKTVYIGFEEAVPVVASLDGVADALSTIGCVQLLVGDDLRAHNAAASELWRAFFAADEAHAASSRWPMARTAAATTLLECSAATTRTGRASSTNMMRRCLSRVEGVAFVAQVEAWRGAVTALARDVLGAVAARRGAPAHMFAAGGAFDASRGGAVSCQEDARRRRARPAAGAPRPEHAEPRRALLGAAVGPRAVWKSKHTARAC